MFPHRLLRQPVFTCLSHIVLAVDRCRGCPSATGPSVSSCSLPIENRLACRDLGERRPRAGRELCGVILGNPLRKFFRYNQRFVPVSNRSDSRLTDLERYHRPLIGDRLDISSRCTCLARSSSRGAPLPCPTNSTLSDFAVSKTAYAFWRPRCCDAARQKQSQGTLFFEFSSRRSLTFPALAGCSGIDRQSREWASCRPRSRSHWIPPCMTRHAVRVAVEHFESGVSNHRFDQSNSRDPVPVIDVLSNRVVKRQGRCAETRRRIPSES